jgi:hypothetical protein
MSDTLNHNKPVIREALIKALYMNPQRPRRGKPKLYPSDAGSCNRKIMLRVMGAKSTEFPQAALEAMQNGIHYEDDSLNLLKRVYGENGVVTQLALQTDYWSGKADFVLNHQTADAIIVEHKATGGKWFDYNKKFPEEKHVIQLALYEDIYEKDHGFKPKLILYYRAWGNWAEFVIKPEADKILVNGWVNGEERNRELDISITKLRRKLEALWKNDRLPKRVARSEMETVGCTFKGSPSCPFYSHCWDIEKSKSEIELVE